MSSSSGLSPQKTNSGFLDDRKTTKKKEKGWMNPFSFFTRKTINKSPAKSNKSESPTKQALSLSSNSPTRHRFSSSIVKSPEMTPKFELKP